MVNVVIISHCFFGNIGVSGNHTSFPKQLNSAIGEGIGITY